MYRIVLLLVWSAFTGRGREGKPAIEPLESDVTLSSQNPLKVLKRILLAHAPPAAFNHCGRGASIPICSFSFPVVGVGSPTVVALPSRRSEMTRMAAKAKSKNKKKKSKGSSGKGSAGGFGAVAAAPSRPTGAEILKESMDIFNELEWIFDGRDVKHKDETDLQAFLEDFRVTEWIITMRSSGSATDRFKDWVPVAVLMLGCHTETPPETLMPAAVSACGKAISIAASQSNPVLNKLDRNSIELAFEPGYDFDKHVLQNFDTYQSTLKKAMATLGVNSTAPGLLKKNYRKLMLELHPDRLSPTEAKAGQARLAQVMEAYDILRATPRGDGSFYEALGAKDRLLFSGALSKEALEPFGKPRPEQELSLNRGGWRAGISAFNSDISDKFMARNVMEHL